MAKSFKNACVCAKFVVPLQRKNMQKSVPLQRIYVKNECVTSDFTTNDTNMKKIITLLLAVISIETLFAKKVQIGDLYYLLDTIHQSASVISPTDTISHYKFTPNTTIHIPDSVSYNHITYSVTDIESSAFLECTGLNSLTIPNSVTFIGWSAFFKCEDLSAITLPDSLQHISPFAFVGCSGLTSIKIPKSVTEIGEGAFAGCTGLTSVEIINKVNEIGGRLFAGCTGLTSVTIGDSVTNIDGDSFDGCIGLTSPIYNAHKFIYMPRFYSGDYTIPDGIESIANCAFEDCTGLTSIKIPNSVTDIGYLAFKGCTGLTSIEFPNSVRSIDFRAFQGCTGLSSITLPNSVTGIGDHAFEDCTNLTSIDISDSLIYIGDNAFSGCPCSRLPIYSKRVFAHMPGSYSGDYTIPDGIESIANYAFSYCTDLTSVTIPNSVTSIGENAFEYCTGLRSMTCLALTPPIINSDIFHNVDCSDITLYVPAKSVQAYKDAEQWNIFKEILPTSKFKMRRKAK